MSSGRRLLDQLDVIKSIANCTGTPHVLVGTYDLLAFRNLSGQLRRRSLDVHFGRYRANRPGEAAIFANVLRSFAAQLPLAEPPDLVKNSIPPRRPLRRFRRRPGRYSFLRAAIGSMRVARRAGR